MRFLFATLIFVQSLNAAGSESTHFYGSGIEDGDTQAVLTLVCADESGPSECPMVQWQVNFSDQTSVRLGNGYSISFNGENEFDAFLQLDGIKRAGEPLDLESNEFARRVLQKYINGLAAHARKNFDEPGGWFRSTNKVFFGRVDVSASWFADRKASYSSLQKVREKNGWSWSSNPKKVSHSYFSKIARLVIKRAFECAQIKSVNGEQSLRNYVETVKSEQAAAKMIRRYGFQAASELNHFTDGAELRATLQKLRVTP